MAEQTVREKIDNTETTYDTLMILADEIDKLRGEVKLTTRALIEDRKKNEDTYSKCMEISNQEASRAAAVLENEDKKPPTHALTCTKCHAYWPLRTLMVPRNYEWHPKMCDGQVLVIGVEIPEEGRGPRDIFQHGSGKEPQQSCECGQRPHQIGCSHPDVS